MKCYVNEFFFWNYHIFDIKIIEINICSIFKKINLQQNTLYRTLSTRVIRIKKRKRKWLEISNISKIKKEVVRVACNTWKRQNEPCVQWDLSATFSLIYIFFFLFLWSGFSDLYLFFNNVHFFLFFSFSVLIFFFFFAIRISKPKIVEVGLRVSCRRLSKSAEKQKAGQMMRHDTRHLDWSFIYIQFLCRSKIFIYNALGKLWIFYFAIWTFRITLKIYIFRKILFFVEHSISGFFKN